MRFETIRPITETLRVPNDKIHVSLQDTGYPFAMTGNNTVMDLQETIVRVIKPVTDGRVLCCKEHADTHRNVDMVTARQMDSSITCVNKDVLGLTACYRTLPSYEHILH
jgi:hypothetical protein